MERIPRLTGRLMGTLRHHRGYTPFASLSRYDSKIENVAANGGRTMFAPTRCGGWMLRPAGAAISHLQLRSG